MGKGIAVLIKEMYPNAYEAYKLAECTNGLHLGDISYAKYYNNLTIVNGITQNDYWVPGAPKDKQYVDYDAIAKVFEQVAKMASLSNTAVHFPLIGAGLGGGRWEDIEPIIAEKMLDVEHTLWKL